jgi:hypothetical protein
VKAFLETNAAKLAGVVQTGARRKLDDAIAELASHVTIQSGSFLDAKGSTQRHVALRAALLRDHMAPIAKIAAADLPNTPAVKPLRMPKGRPTAEKLSAAAYGMGEAAAKFADTFTGAGLPADFVNRLTGAADAMIAALGDRTQSRGQRSGATKGLQATLSRGRKTVAVLDAMVKSALHSDPSLLAEWNAVKRVRVVPSRPAPDAQPTPAAAAAPTGGAA